jgi:hypothetical protein
MKKKFGGSPPPSCFIYKQVNAQPYLNNFALQGTPFHLLSGWVTNDAYGYGEWFQNLHLLAVQLAL